MRKLQITDVFNAMRLIREANLREEIKPIIKQAVSGSFSVEDIGFEGILGVVELFTEKKMEQAFYGFLSGPFETEAQDIATMDLVQFVDKIQELAEANDLRRFFTLLSGLISSK